MAISLKYFDRRCEKTQKPFSKFCSNQHTYKVQKQLSEAFYKKSVLKYLKKFSEKRRIYSLKENLFLLVFQCNLQTDFQSNYLVFC